MDQQMTCALIHPPTLIDFGDGVAKDSGGKEGGGGNEDDALQFSDKNGPPTKSKMCTSPRRNLLFFHPRRCPRTDPPFLKNLHCADDRCRCRLFVSHLITHAHAHGKVKGGHFIVSVRINIDREVLAARTDLSRSQPAASPLHGSYPPLGYTLALDHSRWRD